MSFNFLDSYSTDGKRRFITLESLPGIGGDHPEIEVRFAGRGNNGFLNARAKAKWASGEDEAIAEKMNAEIKADILAPHVVTGWRFMPEDDPDHPGCVRAAEFSTEKAAALLKKLAEKLPGTLEALWRLPQSEAWFLNDVERPKIHPDELGKG